MKQIRVVLFHTGVDASKAYADEINESLTDEAAVVDIHDPRPVRLALPIRATPNVAILLFADTLEEGRELADVLRQLDYFKGEEEVETAFATLAVDSSDMSALSEKARSMRDIYMALAAYAPDAEALAHPEAFDFWEAGKSYAAGDTRRHGDGLYRCLQGHTSQTGWEPPNVPALWAAISPGNTGSLEDPIPAARGMEYTYGLYYLDPEDGKTYLCTRTGEAEGGTVILQYLPHELIGHYFAEVAG